MVIRMRELKEGDYFICWNCEYRVRKITNTEIIAAPSYSKYFGQNIRIGKKSKQYIELLKNQNHGTNKKTKRAQ